MAQQKADFGRQKRDAMRGEQSEFDQRVLELARVTRVTKRGKRMRFRAAVLVGDKKGQVGFGLAKGADVSFAVNKAVRQAKKNLIKIPLVHQTIPHNIKEKFHAAVVLLQPAPQGSGIKAGGAVRAIMELAGVPNISAKILRGKNKVAISRATIEALQKLRK